jgi:hypothetical protein
MRNLLDTASIAQSLDDKRLMGSLPVPDHRIILDRSDYKDRHSQRDMIADWSWCSLLAHPLRGVDGEARCSKSRGVRTRDGWIPCHWPRGDELGWPEHGSTIIVRTAENFESARIRAGEPLMRLARR